MTSKTGMRSALGHARGLGAAGGAAHHWTSQRFSAVALVPLGLWFVFGAVLANLGADQAAIRDWIASPVNATLMILFVILAFQHGALGLQVVLEDYVHGAAAKNVAVIANKMFAAAGALFCVVCVLTLAFGGE